MAHHIGNSGPDDAGVSIISKAFSYHFIQLFVQALRIKVHWKF